MRRELAVPEMRAARREARIVGCRRRGRHAWLGKGRQHVRYAPGGAFVLLAGVEHVKHAEARRGLTSVEIRGELRRAADQLCETGRAAAGLGFADGFHVQAWGTADRGYTVAHAGSVIDA